MTTTQAPTLFDLMLEESRARHLEVIHQRTCRARAEHQACAACLDFEAAWLTADLAVSRALAAAEAEVTV